MTPFLGPTNQGPNRPSSPSPFGVYRGPSRGLFMGPGRGQSRALIDPPGLPFGRVIGVPFGYFQGPVMGLNRGQNSALIDLSETQPFGEPIEAPVM